MIPFRCTDHELTDSLKLTIIDIPSIDDSLRIVLDENFVSICDGESDSSLNTIKKHVQNLFEKKTESWKMGAIAEFFVHLYIKLIGFKQECLFLNLEENSIKKGFDGFYSISNEPWLMESKSGSITTQDISHAGKISEAMKDLAEKVTGGTPGNIPNNPWRNAYSHANQFSVNTAEPLRKWIKNLSDEFTNRTYHSIDEFNTIPCGTIFLAGQWVEQDHKAICESIRVIADKLEGKSVHAICITHASIWSISTQNYPRVSPFPHPLDITLLTGPLFSTKAMYDISTSLLKRKARWRV